MCGNLMLSKLCLIFLAFLEGLHPLCGESKPADSRLAFLTPHFTLSSCIPCRPGAGSHFWPHYPHHEPQHHLEAQGQARQGPWGCSCNPPCSHAKCTGKTNKIIVLVTLWACFCSSFTLQSTYSLKGVCKGDELCQPTLGMGEFGCSCWCGLRSSKHSKCCQMALISSCSLPTPSALLSWTRGVQAHLVQQISVLCFSAALGSIPVPHS